MVLADWTFDAAFTVASPNGSPSVDPFVRMTLPGNNTNTRTTKYAVPSGANVNGQNVQNIQSGRIVSWVQIGVSATQAAQTRAGAVWVCRYTDANNHYRLTVWADFNTGAKTSGYIIEKVKAGVVSTILSGNLTGANNIALSQPTGFVSVRWTWWVTNNLLYHRLEMSFDGQLTWSQFGSDTADSENFNTGSTVTVGVGAETGLDNSVIINAIVDMDGTKIYSS